jgi:hypothetical protein
MKWPPRTAMRTLLLALALAALLLTSPGAALAADLAIYDEALASGWDNWSWSTTTSFAATSPVHGGAKSIAVTYTAGWAGFYLHAASAVDLSGYESLRFWIQGGSAGNQRLQVAANGDGSQTFAVTAQANTWIQVTLPLSTLGSPTSLAGLWWQESTGGAQPTFYLDDIVLVASSGPPPPPPPPGVGPALSIDVGSGRHAISEDIYGMNFADEQMAAALRLPVRRWGGNSTSRYNWQNDTHNTGSDWYFENIPDDNPNPAALPNGSTVDRFVEQDQRTGTKTLLTAPLLGWVPKRRLASHPYDCGFKVSKYGAQQSTDPWDTDCGNGVRSTGGDITGNDPTDTSVQVDPQFVTDWLGHLTGKYGTASQGGVAYYDLDNEPMLWNSTHRDVHPQGVSYDEIRDLTSAYAAAIKAADPSAKTLGPVLWGWCAYFYSARDGCGAGTDYQTHGNMPFVPWYLQQLRTYEEQHGVRLLDYLDLHYYPQASGVALSGAGSAATQALRLRSTRSLWDASYLDESWISDTLPGGVAVRLIPRMKEWVAGNYPGTRLAITEYNWGALDHINGALAQADLLGIFGREGLDLATLWGPPSLGQPGAFAFRMYRNYDGAGSGFGNTSVLATSQDQASLAAYAAQRGTDNALTIVVINKTATSLTSDVGLSGFTPTSAAAVYRYSTASPSTIVREADQSVSAAGFSATFPANSITLFVLMPETTVTFGLAIVKSGTGTGSVTSSPAGIDCGGTCSGEFESGTSVTLTATPATGSTFAGWSGAGCTGTGTCTVTLDAAKNVTATFPLNSYLLSITKAGSADGTVVSDLAGINCGGDCTESYPYGTRVTLTASPASGATLKEWRGACTGTNATCNLTLTGAVTATAVFSQGFTDPALTGVIIKAAHITDLRQAIDTLRSRLALGAFAWTDPTLIVSSTVVKAQHLSDLRTAVNGAYTKAGRTPPSYTDDPVTSKVTPIKAIHISELRNAVRALE